MLIQYSTTVTYIAFIFSMTTEREKNEEVVDATEQPGDTPEHMLEEGKRGSTTTNPSARKNSTALAATSNKYDIDDKGKSNEAEQAMRDMDTSNRGFLSNEEVEKNPKP